MTTKSIGRVILFISSTVVAIAFTFMMGVAHPERVMAQDPICSGREIEEEQPCLKKRGCTFERCTTWISPKNKFPKCLPKNEDTQGDNCKVTKMKQTCAVRGRCRKNVDDICLLVIEQHSVRKNAVIDTGDCDLPDEPTL